MTTSVAGIMRGTRRAKIVEGTPLRREFTESYIVLSTDGTDDEGNVYATAGLPTLGDAWTGDNGSTNLGVVVVGVSIADVDESRKKWTVDIEYSSDLPDGSQGSGGGGGESPPDWTPQIEWDTELEQYTPLRDKSGSFILNRALEPYREPPVLAYRPIITLRYVKWQASFTSASIGNYVSKTNSDPFQGFNPGQAFMHRIAATAHFLFGSTFWQVTYLIRFREDGWKITAMERGPSYYATGGNPASKTSAMREDSAGMVWLNADGTKSDSVQTEEWDIYQSIPFTPLLP